MYIIKMENQTEEYTIAGETAPVPAARKGGRKRVYTDEERKAAARAARMKYEAKRGERLQEVKRERARIFAENYHNESLPLVESQEVPGKYLCTVCSSIIGSHYNFKSHAKSKKHAAALMTPS
jgi:hypothetical protein